MLVLTNLGSYFLLIASVVVLKLYNSKRKMILRSKEMILNLLVICLRGLRTVETNNHKEMEHVIVGTKINSSFFFFLRINQRVNARAHVMACKLREPGKPTCCDPGGIITNSASFGSRTCDQKEQKYFTTIYQKFFLSGPIRSFKLQEPIHR